MGASTFSALAQWNSAVIGATPPAPSGPPFFLLMPAGASAAVQGTGTVFGQIGTTQEVVVRNTPGTITLDGSFNTGGDCILLSGAASSYTVQRNGAGAVISDGDTIVVVPIGTGGADIVFGDGVRALGFDQAAGVLRLGSQALTAFPVVITAGPGTPTATGATSAAIGSQLLVNQGQTATALGKATVFGTIAGAETVTVGAGANLVFDGSFNAGGDTIVLPGARSSWTAVRSGSAAVLTGAGGESVTIPTGPNATTIRFADGDRPLFIDLAAGAIKLGNVALSTMPAVVADAAPSADFNTFVL